MALLKGGSTLNTDQATKNILLKGNTSENDYTFQWTAPATSSRTITLADPGGNDTLTYLAATQTLTNKTLDANSNTVTNIGASEVEAGIVTGQTEEATIAANDVVLIYDTSASALRKMTRANFVSGLVGVSFAMTDGTNTATADASDDPFKIRTADTKLSILVTNDDATHGDNVLFTVNEGNIVHDNLNGFVANEHTDHSGVTLTAGNGLTGGGDITASRSFAVGAGTGISVGTDDVAVDQSFTPTWTGLHTYNPGTTPTDAVKLTIAALGSAGTRDSHNVVLTGQSYDTGAHSVDWKAFVDVTSNAGASTFTIQSRIDAASFANRLTISDSGAVTIPGDLTVSGTTTTISSSTLTVADKNIVVNKGGTTAGATDAGVDVEGDAAATIAGLRYASGSATKWTAGDGTTQYDIVGATATQTLTNKTIGSTCALGAAFDFAGQAVTNVGTFTGKADVNAAANWTVNRYNVSDGTTTGYDSQILYVQGSGYGSGSAKDVKYIVKTNVASDASYQLLISKQVGAGSVVNVLAIDNNGDLLISGVLKEAQTISEL